jgi:heme exporter protein B
MMNFREIRSLILQEIIIEWRLRYALNGILLYLVSIIFICYLSFKSQINTLNPVTWNTLFWIIILFTAVNAVTKSFIQISEGRLLYFYTIASPAAMILSKIAYNSFLLIFISLAGFLFYGFILGNPVQDPALFMLTMLLGSVGFAAVLTMNSGIASKASNSTSLMAILSFPVILPLLLTVIKISKNALEGLDRSASVNQVIFLVSINVIVITMSYILFPYIWRS